MTLPTIQEKLEEMARIKLVGDLDALRVKVMNAVYESPFRAAVTETPLYFKIDTSDVMKSATVSSILGDKNFRKLIIDHCLPDYVAREIEAFVAPKKQKNG